MLLNIRIDGDPPLVMKMNALVVHTGVIPVVAVSLSALDVLWMNITEGEESMTTIMILCRDEGSMIEEDEEIPLLSLKYTWIVPGMVNQFMDGMAAIREVCLVAYTLAIREDRAHTTTITILVIKRLILQIIISILLHGAIIITEAARQEIREMLDGMNWGIQFKLLWKALFVTFLVK